MNNGTNSQDKWCNGGIWVARIYLQHLISYSSYYLYGGARGLVKSDVLCFPSGGTANIGDTMTVGGVTYTVMGKAGQSLVAVVQAN